MDKKTVISAVLAGILCLYCSGSSSPRKDASNPMPKASAALATNTNLVSIIRNGDIIAHTSKSRQSKLIQELTSSRYSHMGIIVKKDQRYFVLEASSTVKYTPLEEWIARGVDGKYTIARLKEPYVSKSGEMIRNAERFLGKPYDIRFEPTESAIYCSELIALGVKPMGIKLGEWEAFGDVVGLKRYIPSVKREIRKRWGESPKDMLLVTPKSVMASKYLEQVSSNY